MSVTNRKLADPDVLVKQGKRKMERMFILKLLPFIYKHHVKTSTFSDELFPSHTFPNTEKKKEKHLNNSNREKLQQSL